MKVPGKIGSSIESVLEQLGILGRIKQYKILELWPEIVGEQIARASAVESIRNGKLFVKVKHPVWRNELQFLKAEIIRKVNDRMGSEFIKDIIFR